MNSTGKSKLVFKVIRLGHLKSRVDWKYLERWESNLFSIHVAEERRNLPNCDLLDFQGYTDATLAEIVSPDPVFGVSIGVIAAPLEGNFYMRRLGENRGVISLFETADILRRNEIPIENFLLRNFYEVLCFYHEGGKKVPTSIVSLTHDETRGCIFDMSGSKEDLVFSTARPALCVECRARLSASVLPRDFLSSLESELKRIKPSRYVRLKTWVHENPLRALGATILASVAVNVFSNWLYDKLK